MTKVVENWKDIPGYVGYYMASNTGLIKSLSRITEGTNCKQKTIPERILKPGVHSSGYWQVSLYLKTKPLHKKVHRLVAAAFLGESALEVNHKDGNKKNNNIDNLEYVEHRDNTRHWVVGKRGFTGISFNKRKKSWKAEFRVDGVKKFFGYFKKPEDAQRRVEDKMKEFGIICKY